MRDLRFCRRTLSPEDEGSATRSFGFSRISGALRCARMGCRFPRRVVKGGSHLCAPSYCLRHRPAARQPEAIDTSTSQIGFRSIVREDS